MHHALPVLQADIASTAARHLRALAFALQDLSLFVGTALLQLARPALQESIVFWAVPAPLATGPVLLVRIPSKEQA